MLDMVLEYSKDHDEKLYNYVSKNPEYFKEIINIERENENPRKDYYKLGGLLETIGFFYNDIYDNAFDANIYNPNIPNNVKKDLLVDLKENGKLTLKIFPITHYDVIGKIIVITTL